MKPDGSYGTLFGKRCLPGLRMCGMHEAGTVSRRTALLLMFLIPVLWSVAGIFTRQLSSIQNVEIVFWRGLFVSLCILAYLLARKREGFFLSVLGLGRTGFASGVLWAVIFTCFMLSLTLTTVANTLLVSSITPFLTALFSWLFLGVRVSARTWATIVFSFLGVAVIFFGSVGDARDGHTAGLLLALAVPFSYAVNYMIFSRSGKTVDLKPAIFLGGALSAMAMIPLAFPFEASVRDIGILAFLGVFQLGIPCLLLVYVARYLPPTEIAMIAMLEIVLGPLWVWIGVNETPAPGTLIGGLMVLLCLLIHEVISMLHFRKGNQASSIPRKEQ